MLFRSGEIGAIRILPNETWFQVPRAIEAKFKAALKRTGREGAEDESGIAIEQAHGTPPEMQRGPRGGRPNGGMQRRDFRDNQGDRGHRKGPRGPGRPPRA